MTLEQRALFTQLSTLLPGDHQVVKTASVLEGHGRDLTYHPPHQPDVVVYPRNREDVVQVMQFAHAHQIPVVPYGAGSSLEGHTIPIHGGISLDLSQMNQILEFRPEDLIVRVEPGVTRIQLNEFINRHGVHFPVDPGANATLGGMTATNASGTNAVRYGAMRDNVRGLEVVLADGSIVHTGGMTVKSSAGYNLTGLFVGSEGTLGVFTSITLRLQPIPEATLAARAVFDDIDTIGDVAAEILSCGVAIGRIELVDAGTVRAVNAYKGTAYEEKPTLFLEFSGTKHHVEEDVEAVRLLCEEGGCTQFIFEREGTARAKLWEARHSAAMAIMARQPGKKHMSTDVCVPLSEMPGALKHARRTIDAFQIDGVILGHIGDGNYHASFMVDPTVPSDMERLYAVNEAIVSYALERGGTCTGEHGVGLGKRKFLAREHGDAAIQLMRTLKGAMDPLGIMNPGKVL